MRSRASRRVVARYNWDRLKVSFWFAPLVMSLGAILLAWAIYRLDSIIPNETLQSSRLVLSGTPDALRSSLLTIATTTLATAGVVFTLLTLPLSTVAAQYGSRLLRVFLGDRTTQIVLGLFTATFFYSLAAALSIPPTEVEPEAPQITATVGLLMMVATFGSLIVLVQHISTMLQAPNIAAGAGAKLVEVIQSEIPAEVSSEEGKISNDDQTGQEAAQALLASEGYGVHVKDTGYIQYIDPGTILILAREKDLVIRLLHRPGDFVRLDQAVALVWPADRVDEQLAGQILLSFRLGNTRTPTQDIEYGVNQLVEMAVRAMSPAINDPFTAITCLDYIADGLALFARQGENGSHYYDREGKLRLVFEPITFEELLGAAFDMLRHCSSDNVSVMLHMLEAIDRIGDETKPPAMRQLLRRHVSLILAESQASHLIDADRQLIQRSSETLSLKLSQAG